MMQNTCFYKGNECFKINDVKTMGGVDSWLGYCLGWFSKRQSLNHHPLLHTDGHGSGVKQADKEHHGSISGPLVFLGSDFTC